MTENIHYSKEIEAAILGACLLEKTAFGRIYGKVTKESFYVLANQTVFEKLNTMWNDSYPIDLLTVNYGLHKEGVTHLNGDSTAYYLTRLTNEVKSTANLEAHSLILREMHIERELMALTSSGRGKDEIFKTITELQNKLTNLTQIKATDDFKGMDELLVDMYQHMDRVQGDELAGVTTGFKKLDKLTGGLMPGGMYIVGARPSVGKSAFMNKMLLAPAQLGKKVAVISLEMEDKQISARISSLVTEVEYWRIYRNRMFDQNQRDHFHEEVRKLGHLPIRISDTANVDLGDIKAKVARLKQRNEVDILFIDYLQLIDSPDNNRSREQEVSKISRGIKLMAKQFEIPIVILCQLNRLSEEKKEKPKLHNLRESGSLEQDADGVIFLHRDFMSGIKINSEGQSTENEADIIIAKWRDGECVEYKIGFDGPKMKFYEFEESNWQPIENPF